MQGKSVLFVAIGRLVRFDVMRLQSRVHLNRTEFLVNT